MEVYIHVFLTSIRQVGQWSVIRFLRLFNDVL